ncbi:MAG: FtsX-like permease family protein [Acidimicrobiia bacterium]|nr:FtsX-like permease family protein [Acidimicrobiia bacterium]
MLRLTLESLRNRKLRLLSTAASIVIGVAFLAGSLVLIDTIGRTFDDLLADVNQGVDVEIRSSEVIETPFGTFRGRIDGSIIDQVRQVEGVEEAVGGVAGYAQLVDPNGEPMGNPGQGAPTFGFGWTDVEPLNPMVLVEGKAPATPTEIVIDRMSAKNGPFSVGDDVTVLLESGPEVFTVSGIASFGAADSPLGASVALFEPETAQRLLAEPGRFDVIDIVATEGVSQSALRERVAGVVPAGTDVITGEDLISESQNEVGEALSFFGTFMLIFSGIALFVAAFIIYNTFSILVAQRTRELALLRSLGAHRRQLLFSVMGEALVVGLVASIIGMAAGVGVARGLKQLLAALGLAIPASGVVLEPATAVWSLVIGVGMTMVSAVVPSRRSATVAPMEAIRTATVEATGLPRRRLAGGVGMLVVGVAVLLWGLLGNPPSTTLFIAIGAAGVFLGVAGLAPIVAVPFSDMVGRPISWLRGVPGELARENAMRNPRRTATTAAALMIGVGLVATISIFAASAKASINKIIDDAFVGDLVVDSGTVGFGGLSPELAARLNEQPEVEAASGVRLGFAEIDGEAQTLYGVDPSTMGDIIDVGVLSGSIESLGPDDIAVHDELAAERGWSMGDEIDVRFAETGLRPMTISVIYERNELTGNFFVGNPAFEANFPSVFDFQVAVLGSDDFSSAETLAAVESIAAVQDLSEYKQSQADQINQLLSLVYALLFLAIIIALIGIANTLALSILERTHELGLLRAIGMTRAQLRSSIRWESVLIALLGTALGAVVGVFFGWAIAQALEGEGFTELRLPVGQLFVAVALAMIAGVIAATMPARRAANMNVLDAVAAE